MTFVKGAPGVVVVRALVEAGHGVDAVFLTSERQDNDGILKAREEIGVEMNGVAVVNLPDSHTVLSARSPRLLEIGGSSQTFCKPLLDIADHGAINLHAGHLPGYRGGSPLSWQITGETSAGISTLKLIERIDTGDILTETEIEIGRDDTIADLHGRVHTVFPKLVRDVISDLERRAMASRLQDEARACYWHQRNDADGHIPWREAGADRVLDVVAALHENRVSVYGAQAR